MAVALTWVRDRYDASKNRYIEMSEAGKAMSDHSNGTITQEQMDAVVDAWNSHVLLPAYTTPTIPEHMVSFNVTTGSILKIMSGGL